VAAWFADKFLCVFENVLEGSSTQSHMCITSQSKYNEIMNCINHELLATIRDLLFEVISIAQHYYVEHMCIWEQPKMQN
jgi:hypothetical protein